MDQRKPTPSQRENKVPSPIEDQAKDEDSEEMTPTSEEETASKEETGSQSQTPFELIKFKTSSGLKKLRGSISSWRKSAATDVAEENKKQTSLSRPKVVKHVIDGERSQSKRHYSKGNESQLSLDSNSEFDNFQEKTQPSNKTIALATEPYCKKQHSSPTSRPNSRQPVPEKDNVVRTDNVLQSEYSETLNIQRPLVSTSHTPSIPPPVPPRRPKDHIFEQEVQQPQSNNQAELVASNFPKTVAPQTNQVTLSQSFNIQQENNLKEIAVPLFGSNVGFNTNTDVQSGPVVGQDRALSHLNHNTQFEEFHISRSKVPELNDSDSQKDFGEKEMSQEVFATNPFLNEHAQSPEGCHSLNPENAFYTKAPPPFYRGNIIQDPDSPPVLTVHQTHRQGRSTDSKLNDPTNGVVTNSDQLHLANIPQDASSPLRPDAVEELQTQAPTKYQPHISSISHIQTNLIMNSLDRTLENSKSIGPMKQFQQRDANWRTAVQLKPSYKNNVDEHLNQQMGRGQTFPYYTAPQKPAPTPPPVRSTIVQYPGPLKGYTAPSAPSWSNAYPPPLPPPPPPRLLAPTEQVLPPSYLNYDGSEPRPYMPTTEPIPRKTVGLSFLNTIRLWSENLSRKMRSSSDQSKPSTMSGFGGLVSSSQWKTRLFLGTSTRHFSSLSAAAGSQDAPGSPVDPKKASGVWIFQPSVSQSNVSMEDKGRNHGGDNIPENLFGEDVYKICVIQMACCCCWPIGLASRFLSSTVYRDNRQPTHAFIHTMAANQTWYALLLGISLYFFLFVFTLSLLTVRSS